MTELYTEAYQSLRQGRALVIATIIIASGSTPRMAGAKMIVYQDGQLSGTIGGGAVEAEAVRIAKEIFDSQAAVVCFYDLNSTGETDRLDQICGGRMQVLIEYVPATDENRTIYSVICEEMARSGTLILVTLVRRDGLQWLVERVVRTARKEWVGSLEVVREVRSAIANLDTVRDNETVLIDQEERLYFVESIMPPETVFLIGGGHVSGEIAPLVKKVGFRTHVFDDRQAFANLERFAGVDGVHVCPGFDGLFEAFDINVDSYIIIMTRGHRFDRDVLAQALQTKAGYIGMIGSRRKKESIYQSLLGEGFEESTLAGVHCPIGLSIGAETPAEIAVSVVAELIRHRAERRSHGR